MFPAVQMAKKSLKGRELGGIDALALAAQPMGDYRSSNTHQTWALPCRLRGANHIVLVMLAIICGLFVCVTDAWERAKPFLIGALTIGPGGNRSGRKSGE
jgi:hypothetical protein